jgi:hypothetical protein
MTRPSLLKLLERTWPLLAALFLIAVASPVEAAKETSALVKKEFVFEQAPFRSCHASTVVETPSGLVCAWFGGSDEGNSDVTIWLSRQEGGVWTGPTEVAIGAERDKREPCWNPVLFRYPDGPLMLSSTRLAPTHAPGGAWRWSRPTRVKPGASHAGCQKESWGPSKTSRCYWAKDCCARRAPSTTAGACRWNGRPTREKLGSAPSR